MLSRDKPGDEGSPPSCLGTLEMAYQEAGLRAEFQGVSSVSSGESLVAGIEHSQQLRLVQAQIEERQDSW